MNKQRILRIEYDQQYPFWSMLVAWVLILASPFVSVLLSYAALAICLYRVFRYDAKVFATDYVILAPLSRIFKTSGGLTLLIILCLIAAVVFLVREGAKADSTFVLILALLNYLLLRMDMNISAYLLCFGQIFLLWVLLPKQDADSAIRTAKMYCYGLLAASIYAVLLNGTWQIQALIGEGSEAIWGTGIMRFHGLIGDPNFYMTELIVGLALLAKLRETRHIKLVPFIIMGVAMALLGALTYSKTFFLALAIFAGIYIIWQFRNKKIILGVLLVAAVVISAEFLLFSEDSPFSVIVRRFLEGEDLNDLTTGRTGIFEQYIEAICKTPGKFFFGYGLNAPLLGKAPHNIYLEILYYCGAVGFVLFASFISVMTGQLKRRSETIGSQSLIAKYVVFAMVLLLFMSLNGILMVDVYPSFFLGALAILIPVNEA